MEFQELWTNGALDSDEEGYDFEEHFEEEDEEDNFDFVEYFEESSEEEEEEEEEEDSEDFEEEDSEEEEEEEEEEEDSEDFEEEDSEDFEEEEDSQDSEDFEEEEEEVIKERWMNDYCNLHKILLVGEGDFSFSASLAVAFGTSATNIIATSLDSTGYLRENYRSAMSNIEELTSRGSKVLHCMDATKMANHLLLKGMKFDRIVFNFPHAGFFQNTSRETELRRNKKLVEQFLVNAKKMIASNGEIHVRHKSNGFFREWNLELLGAFRGLRLIEEVHFNFTDYPGYRTKYGFGTDNNFNCNPSKTYKFGLA